MTSQKSSQKCCSFAVACFEGFSLLVMNGSITCSKGMMVSTNKFTIGMTVLKIEDIDGWSESFEHPAIKEVTPMAHNKNMTNPCSTE